jgi:tRNA threonylcarbamoyladenosine biosynthesis protein TsaB
MHILALETSDLSGSVAALIDGHVVACRDLDSTTRSAQSLAPAISELLAEIGWRPSDVLLVAVGVGPGSFTGLRVGVTTAKMFAYAVGAEVLGVNTLEVIAWQAPAEIREMWAVLDAQREQVFAGHFSRETGGAWQWQGETQLLDNDAWLSKITAGQAVSGQGLMKLIDRILAATLVFNRVLWTPKAVSVGALAWQHYQAGRRDDLGRIIPQYFRQSAAEEKLASRAFNAK